MGTISSALSSYYQLSGTQTGTSSTGANTGSIANVTASLLAALNDSSMDNSSSSDSDAYTLNLSSEAQALLNGSNSTSSTDSSSSSNFVLSSAQQQTITSILDKYKNAPFTQATFDDIQNDLKSAGLDPTTLSLEDSMQNFSGTSVLLSALSGNYSSSQDTVGSSAESTKESNYMQSIISQWKSISTTASSTDTTSTSSS